MKVTIVNMIQPSLSGETNHDTEPNLAVNPANVEQIAGTAFSPDPMGGGQGPVYRSTNEGGSWDAPDFFPTQTVDQTLRFAGNSNRLYASYIDTSFNTHVVVKSDLTVNGLAADINTKPGTYPTVYDQPYIQAYSVMGGSGTNTDRIYIGGNDHGLANIPAAIIQSLDAGAAAPVFNQYKIEARAVSRNGPQVRIAAHANGTTYAAFYSYTGSTATAIIADVVVVRDDNWGNAATPYKDLKDTDMVAGKKAATGVQFIWAYLVGNQRTSGEIAIAVDPRNSATVYLAYAEMVGAVYTTHVVRSIDSGATWSGDLLPITNATHACLTINSHGKIGYIYQQVTGTGASQRWNTHFRTSDDGTTWDDLLLCSAFLSSPGNAPNGVFGLGDYTNVMAIGKNFYGIFPADNTPNLSNFPATATVTYNRNHNFVTNQLFANDGTTVVKSSVDAFFFKIEQLSPDDDFYVRDWTSTTANHDLGQEPSTYPYFYAGSDVWNKSTNDPGTLINDQPQSDPINAGAAPAGANYAFARISRNSANTATTVNAEFLFANYGLGVPYISLGAPVPVTFNMGDLQQYVSLPWHLDTTLSTHCCLAVQISTANDPYIAPGLLGLSPGWPSTDLMVINDNNKAQRNLSVVLGSTEAGAMTYLRVRNAANYTRDLEVKYELLAKANFRNPKITVGVTGSERENYKEGDHIVLRNMKPGENRWITVSFAGFEAKEGAELAVNFSEMKGNQVLNGCTVLLKASGRDNVIKSILQLQQSVFGRINSLTKITVDKKTIDLNTRLQRGKRFEEPYIKGTHVFFQALTFVSSQLSEHADFRELDIDDQLKVLNSTISAGNLNKVLSAHHTLLQKMDNYLTVRALSEGDLACILSNVIWQYELYSEAEALSRLKSTERMLVAAKEFIDGYPRRKVTNKDYPKLIKASLACFNETAKSGKIKLADLDENLAAIDANINSLQKLQKAHYDFLLKLSNYLS